MANLFHNVLICFKTVSLQFNEFSTEYHKDFVLLFDGNTSSAPPIAILSGTSVDRRHAYTSTQRFMYIRMTTAGSSISAKFVATYRITKDDSGKLIKQTHLQLNAIAS